jgi:two-component system LytT family response regulator
MKSQFSTSEMNGERVMFKCSRSIEFIEVRKIIHAESLRAYCKLYISGDDPLLLSCPLKKLEDKLQNYPYFFRSHKSHLINLYHVKSYHTDRGIKLVNGSCVPMACAVKADFLKKMEIFFG